MYLLTTITGVFDCILPKQIVENHLGKSERGLWPQIQERTLWFPMCGSH